MEVSAPLKQTDPRHHPVFLSGQRSKCERRVRLLLFTCVLCGPKAGRGEPRLRSKCECVSMCMYVYLCVCLCACMCVCDQQHLLHAHIGTLRVI